MSDRIGRLLRPLIWILAGAFIVQLALMVVRRDPSNGLVAPVVPRWLPDPGTTNGEPAALPAKAATNVAVLPAPGTTATNALAGTNAMAGTNAVMGTNTVTGTHGLAGSSTNTATGTNAVAGTNAVTGTNVSAGTGTNAATGTNIVAGTHASVGTSPRVAAPSRMPPGFPGGMPGSRASRPQAPLSPLVQARIDRITKSEMLAPVFRPPPMALLGIAGHSAFIRTPSGQSTLLREGGESDGIKLLRLGTNRVLIEQGSEKKELIIFNGLGGESLLTK